MIWKWIEKIFCARLFVGIGLDVIHCVWFLVEQWLQLWSIYVSHMCRVKVSTKFDIKKLGGKKSPILWKGTAVGELCLNRNEKIHQPLQKKCIPM